VHSITEYGHTPALSAGGPRTRVFADGRGTLESRMVASAAACFEAIRRTFARQRQRGELRELGDRELRDIGLSRLEALAEGCKPFWK
jgi:uncharacterized protein YjiS (DUF1127 family)